LTWLHWIRLRALAFVVGVALAAVATISITTWPAWPVIGVAVAAVAMAVNSITARLGGTACLGCGRDLSGQPSGTYGVACTDCGAINLKIPGGPAPLDDGPDEPATA
jgi:hypothetical protein